MYKLKCDGITTSHESVKSAKRIADTAIDCGAYNAIIYRGNLVYAHRAYNTSWQRVVRCKLA